jgi:DNA-directed RNA polymerase specialized sigma24 family protein
LRALPLELREVVVLKELLRWTPDRIGAVLSVDNNEVTHRLLLARTQMAENMRGAP